MAKRPGSVEGVDLISPAFWRGRRVLLTGHTGFKGSWLSLWLQQLGADVTGYALAPATTPNLFSLAEVGHGMRSVMGDLRDADLLRQTVMEAKPEVVIHMAAQALVRYSYEHPVETYAVNVMGLVHVFEAVRAAPSVRAVVNVTSDKCYDNQEWLWGYRENEAMGGADPYSSSKGCAELITAAYRRSYFSEGVALASARAGNVIGGGDWAPDRLVPDIMRAIAAGEEVVLRHPQAVRPWQHVLEPLSGYLTLAQALFEQGAAYAEAWNFGPRAEDARPVLWLVEQLTRRWGGEARYRIESGAKAVHEAQLLQLDCSKARLRLDWQARWGLEHSLQAIVDWHQAHQRGEGSLRALCLQQIHTYNTHRTEA